jgi:hypothetical protein
MPFALTTIGLLLIVTGFQNTYSQMATQLEEDFTGQGNFIYWLISIGVVGALGYNKTLEPFSRAFMGLIIVVLFLSNKGFFSQINSEISSGSSTTPLPAGGVSSGASGSSGGGILGDLGLSNIGSDVNIVSEVSSFF